VQSKFSLLLMVNLGEPNLSNITKAEYPEIAAQPYDQLQALNKIDNFYDYEKKFVNILNDLGREVLEKNLGELVKDNRKKRAKT
jgi:hypothetical protein